jgi:hypothetical protein
MVLLTEKQYIYTQIKPVRPKDESASQHKKDECN